MDADDFREILREIRRFVRTEVVPAEAEIEERDEVPARLREQAKALGLFGFALPAEHGGLGMTMEEQVRLVFELGWTTPAFRSLFGTNNGIAGHVLIEGGTDAQREELLPRIASGEAVAAFALTEPDAGSDPSDLATTAVPDNGGWRLDGSKRFITNAPLADLFMVFARTPDGGVSAFVVEAKTPGLTVAPRDHKMGQRGAWTADVNLDGVRVGPDGLVGGEPGTAWATAMRCLAHGRLHVAAMSVGLAQRAVDESVAWALERRQGGRPIADFQLVQGMLADAQTDLMAGRALVLDAARAYDSGEDRRLGPAAAKYFASEMACRVADIAVQVHGGSGYIRGVTAERLYRDARLFRIYEGTSQIQQVVIARRLLTGSSRRTS
jgi:acyl-CoA dehydrogenase